MVDDRDDAVHQLDGTLRGVAGADTVVAEPLTVPQAPHALAHAPARPVALGPYELGDVLGRGGMGEVVLARDHNIGRDVAIKRMLAAEPSADEHGRFMREARVQGQLEHPAVVPVYDLGIDRDGRPFFVMKRLSGKAMNGLLRGRESADRASRRRLLHALVDVCLAVEFAHSRDIVHRDLKPANIMLGDFGEVYVLDWGIARAITDSESGAVPRPSMLDLRLDSGDTKVGTVMGTVTYMAPEQLVGDRAGPAADIYSLGCILYEIVAGRALHPTGRDLAAELDARPSTVRADAPPELDAICERATALQPSQRYPTARALGDAVQAYLDGDRDLVARRELANGHIAQARDAIARGDGEDDRKAAMRAAGRALALDPTATAAAELVTHLMLRPPKAMPAEVEHHVAELDVQNAREQARVAALAMLGYLAIVPLMLWTGVRDYRYVAAFTVLPIAVSLHLVVQVRRRRITPTGLYVSVCINAALIALVCCVVGPFTIAPWLATTTLMAYAVHPQLGHLRAIAGILGAAVIVPWTLELVGAIARTHEFVDGKLVLTSPGLAYREAPFEMALALVFVMLMIVVSLLSRRIATRLRDVSQQVELQAWHLRQLVP